MTATVSLDALNGELTTLDPSIAVRLVAEGTINEHMVCSKNDRHASVSVADDDGWFDIAALDIVDGELEAGSWDGEEGVSAAAATIVRLVG